MKKKLISIHKNEKMGDEQYGSLRQRLESLGFFPGTEVEVLKKISFEEVIIVRIYQTVIALNRLEFLCLKF